MKAIKIINVSVPDYLVKNETVRWVVPSELEDLSAHGPSDEVEPVELRYREGRIRHLKRSNSDNVLSIIIDEDSDTKETLDFFDEVYNLALADLAEALGSETETLRNRVDMYWQVKYMRGNWK